MGTSETVTGGESSGPSADGAGAGHAEHDHRSRWPLVAAAGAAALYAGVGLALVGFDLVPRALSLGLLALGLVGFVGGLTGWAYEAFVAPYWESTGTHEDSYVGGMVLFLLSDVATFAAGFVYYAFIRVGTWPPTDLPHLLGSLVLFNTVVLIASSVTLHFAHTALEAGDRRRFLGLLGVTTGLGLIFVGGQALEYYEFIIETGFTLTSGAFASAFYGLTGLHGLHVTLGVILLGFTLSRGLRGAYDAERDTAVRTVSLYWHFVDAVWLFLVAVLYVGAVLG